MKQANRHIARAVALVAAAGLALFSARTAAAQEWEFDAALYAWLYGIDGTIGVSALGTGIPVDASFSDLAGFLDFAAAGHFEAKNSRVVLLADINYAGLGSKRDVEILGQPITIDMDFAQWVIEAGGGYRLSSEFDLLLVGRYYIQELGETATAIGGGGSSFDATKNWGDIFFGARYMKTLGARWLLSLRGDIGTGGSKFAWFGNAGIGYRLSDLLTLGLGYRILSLDYETDPGPDYYKFDAALGGLGLVLDFTF